MNTSSTAELLRGLPFARGMPEKAVPRLAEIALPREFAAHTLIFKEGDRHEQAYLLLDGSIALDMQVPGRGNVRILSLGSTDLLGWSPIVGDEFMTATATTQEKTTTLALPSHALKELCDSDHEIGYWVMSKVATAMSQRLLATRLQLLDLFAETTPTADWT